MDEKKDNDSDHVDIMAFSKNIDFPIIIKTMKVLVIALQNTVLQQYCGQHLAEAEHDGCPRAVHQLQVQDVYCFEDEEFRQGCLWDLLSSCLEDLCFAALGLMPCCLRDVCLAALGMYALLPLWIWSFAAQRKVYNLAPQKRIIQCGSLQDYSAWLPEEDYSAWLLEKFLTWPPRRGLPSLAVPTPSRASTASSRPKHNSFPCGSVTAGFAV